MLKMAFLQKTTMKKLLMISTAIFITFSVNILVFYRKSQNITLPKVDLKTLNNNTVYFNTSDNNIIMANLLLLAFGQHGANLVSKS